MSKPNRTNTLYRKYKQDRVCSRPWFAADYSDPFSRGAEAKSSKCVITAATNAKNGKRFSAQISIKQVRDAIREQISTKYLYLITWYI